ncbi:inward rectifier potassium channel [Pustulibacterium marinum]|uniref:Inward rectifier potassium channel n=1 Tax=Pustulibacterium marinum TaxID=1224947 RepID=A0A1I7IKF1_9FLAO|nr:ion channel [Pustulibacterium marinum]SFU73403.1 inward rectifier potassium channel [Pustulibacterium marinum]
MPKKINDPGFGNFSTKNIQRYVNKDGTFNIKHINKSNTISATYSYLIGISWLKFFSLVVLCYTVINILFACIYLIIGIEKLTPSTGDLLHDFFNAFFFSAQTITTVGYGGISPNGVLTGLVSSFEAMLGLLCFSFVTGLLYGRFSKPKANVKFSNSIVLREFQEQNAIMFRVMNTQKSIMIRPKVTATLLLSEEEKQEYRSSFYQLSLERDTITYLPTTWTIVHVIDENSPLKKYELEDLKRLHAEIVILISFYDDAFNQEVHQVHSYLLSELLVDQKFEKAFMFNDEGEMIFDHDKFNTTIPNSR